MNYTCPVCGYNQLRFPPRDFTICPSCGTEFGNDDFELTYNEIRQRWIAAGAQWFSDALPRPNDWDPFKQLKYVILNEALAGEHTSKAAFSVVGQGPMIKPTTSQVIAPDNDYVPLSRIFSIASNRQALAAL